MRSDGDSELEPGGDSTSRRTGIRVIGDLSWGAHICMFYETEEDLLDTALAYFEAGLESNELCVWAVSEPTTVEAATNALRRGVTDFDRYLASGQIAILEGYDWYLRGGEF
ncbi:MAG TPA: MEDS domain-containing protein, partial [Gammaproteobacteria bacterium]|nr:MEDS domain-containing protein [Gammaproteobacteria bacterium]